MKMQIAFRETGTQRAGYRVAIAGGIVETHPSDRLSYDECHMPFDLSCHGDGTVMLAYCHRNPTRIAYDEIHLEMETLEGLLARDMSRMRPSPVANAEFALRETALEPGPAGGMVYAFSGFYYLDHSTTLDFAKVYQLESRDESGDHVMMRTGVLGQDIRPELAGIDAVADMRGHSMTELLKKPWWGFGDEPTSLPGTMRKGIYEELDRFHHLHFVENERDTGEYRYLLDRMKSMGFTAFLNDPLYEKFLKARYDDPDIDNGFRPIPLSRMASRDDALARLVKVLLNDDPIAGSGPKL